MTIEIIEGDCREVLKELETNSVDSVVTDPPYGLEFMGKQWDYDVPGIDVWKEVFRVLKPGGHLLSFFGTRTYHRGVIPIEDAGFEIRDQIGWLYGSGFPKSFNVQQAINKAARGFPHGGADPTSPNHGKFKGGVSKDNKRGQGFGAGAAAFMSEMSEGRGDDEGPWQGWGTALKPAWEPIVVARKPLVGTMVKNLAAHGVGALNIDGCRVAAEGGSPTVQRRESARRNNTDYTGGGVKAIVTDAEGRFQRRGDPETFMRPRDSELLGRWPANVIHDGSDEVLAAFPHTASGTGAVKKASSADGHGNAAAAYGAESRPAGTPMISYGDSGSAARFFYCAKASKKDRSEGNIHPTVKPTDLMRYLCRLVTPPGGTVLDPFMGSGSTGRAAVLEGFNFIGIEMTPEYYDIADRRIAEAEAQMKPKMQAAE